MRSGTHDTASIVAMAAALTDTVDGVAERHTQLTRLREKMIAGVRALDPDVIVNGPDGADRLAGNAHFTFPGCEGDSLLMLLDAAGIECSTGSACTAGVASASHVLIAMGADPFTARGSLRFSLGSDSSESDVDALLAALPHVIERARAAGLASVGARGGQR